MLSLLSSQHPSRHFQNTSWVIFSSLFALALLLLNGCGMMNTSMMSPGTAMSFAFVTNSGSGTVSVFAVSSTGMMSPVSGSPFAAGAGAEFLAFDAMHKVLFVSNQGANTVSAFSVNTATGMLAAISGSPFPTGARPTGIAVDPMGRFVFVANQASSSVSVFNIGSNGALAPVAGSPFAATNPFGLAVNPAGTVLFANNFPDSQTADLNTVSSFQIGMDGALNPIAGSPFPTASSAGFASSIGLAMDPTGNFLFVGDHMAQAVVPFSVSSTGTLTPISALPPAVPSCNGSCHNNPLRVAVHPNSQFVFATNVQAGTVSTFKVTNGALTSVGDVPTGQHPFGVALDPSGGFLFVVNNVDNTVSAFAVNMSSGMASPVSGSPFSGSMNQPTDIVVVTKQ